MSNRRIPITALIAFCFFIAACAPAGDGGVIESGSLSLAVSDGIIADIEPQARDESDYNLIEAVLSDISRTVEVRVTLEALISRDLYFVRDEGRLTGIYVTVNQFVQKGDVLAAVEFEKEELDAARIRLLLNMEQYERRFDAENTRHLEDLEDMRNDYLMQANEVDMEIKALQIMKQELHYQNFLRQDGYTRENYKKQLDDIDEMLEGEQITAPFDGVVIRARSDRAGSIMRNNYVIFVIVDINYLQFSATADIDTIRYGDVFPVLFRSDELWFDMHVISDPVAQNTRQGQYKFTLMPVDEKSFWEAINELELDYSTLFNRTILGFPMAFNVKNTLVVPRAAINMEDEQQFVYIYEDGTLKKRYVALGLTDGPNYQVLSGVEPGQLLLLDR